MNKHLEQLIQLSLIDKEIDAFEPQIQRVTLHHEALLATRKNIEDDIMVLQQEIKDEQLKKHKNELHLGELSSKLSETAKKSTDIKTEREMKSLQIEEDIAKEQVNFANEEIERIEKLIDHKQARIDEFTAKIAQVEADLEVAKIDMDSKLEQINQERTQIFTQREQLVNTMNQKGLSFYQKIRRWAKNTTAVAVRHQACMGCYMAISDKIYADVIKGEEITTCPHCGRILFLEPDASL